MNPSEELARKTRRGFVVAGLAAAAGAAGFQWLRNSPLDSGTPAPLRSALSVNEGVARAYFKNNRRAREFSAAQAREPRANGKVGIDSELEASSWRLKLARDGGEDPLEMQLDDVRRLPKADMVTEIHCIEGWSEVVHWSGARFRDFVEKYPPSSRNLPRYIALETPDGEYYAGLDIQSAMHPQTLLCYEMNDSPLTSEHGAPLRLVIPVKYGIKNLKRIGTIRYTDERPADYWAERGYDWYAGL